MSLPLALQIDQDMIWLIFLVLWGLYSMFFGKKKGQEELDPEQNAEAQRRAQEIQEEIRRRIREQQETAGHRRIEEMVHEDEQEHPLPPETPPPLTHRPKPVLQPRYPSPAKPVQSWIEQLEQARLQQKETERQVEDARLKTAARTKAAAAQPEPVAWHPYTASTTFLVSGSTQQAISAQLQSPEAIRNAIIMAEVLGGPVSERGDHLKPRF